MPRVQKKKGKEGPNMIFWGFMLPLLLIAVWGIIRHGPGKE